MEVIVVGAGIMGLATAWACHRRGDSVRVYEQGPIPNPHASSVDEHRAIRQIYGDKEGYARMIGGAFEAWDLVWQDLDERLYAETGILTLVRGRDSFGYRSIATLDRVGIDYERLEPVELAARFPLMRFDGVDCGLYFRRGGALLAGRIIERLGHHLGTRGVTIHAHSAVTAIGPDAATVTLADGRRDHADRLVVAAGPWVGDLVPDFAARVTPSRQIVAYLTPPDDLAAAWAAAPILVDIGPDEGLYLVPPVGGTSMKVGDHGFSLSGHPSADREAAPAETRAIYQLCRRRVADLDRFRLASGRTCFYTISPDENIIVEPIGDRVWVMTGFSGHGFKFGPLLGLELADAMAGGQEPAALGRWAAGLEGARPG
ncbi:MAG: FAD-dependent oxidoreductase [Alphaproteobacteria bacterium]|nr:FAD-dependent oxidoreductase [Alphaproteobacteria bacterium]